MHRTLLLDLDMDKIERLRQEIKRLRKEIKDEKDPLAPNQKAGYLFALTDMESFLDTLSKEDTLPCWKKVHTYTEELREGDMEKMLLDLSVGKGKRETKIALPDKVVDALSEEPDKSLEEAAEEYAYRQYMNRCEGEDWSSSEQDFIAGAEWQASQMPMPEDTVLFQKGVAEGRRLEREDMLKDAVEGTVENWNPDPNPEVTIPLNPDEFVSGDKVRIIIVNEEE